jgi:sec-independent protein translocase protein TatB
MFDIAWSEMVLIGAVALVVIGPKDLPKALRTVGQTVGRVRRMAAEFQGQFNEAMREAELADLKKQVEDVGGSVSSSLNTDFNPIEQPKDFSASGGAATPDEAALKEAEGKLAALPTPELPPVDIAAETPVPEAEPVPAAKPKRTRKAKAQDEAAAGETPAVEAIPASAAPQGEATETPKPARARRGKAAVEAAAEPEVSLPEAASTGADEEAPKPARKRKPKAATAKGEETSA